MSTFPPGQGSSYAESSYDPLVPPPYGGLAPLWERLRHLLRLCGKPVAGIILLTFAVPQIAQAWVVNVMVDGLVATGGGLVLPADDASTAEIALPSAGLVGWLILAYVAVALVGAIGWGAGIWSVTQAGAGLPVNLGEALSAGARRMVPMFGWYVLYTLMVAVGTLLCLLPGLYLLVAGGLFSFAVIYERGRNPMGRSFTLVHSAFGAVLGRFALLGLFMLVVFCVVGVVVSLLGLGEVATSSAGRFAGDVILSLVLVPVYTVLLVGLLLTYTQVRARQEEVHTAGLWAAANAEAVGGPPGYPGPVPPG